MDHDKSRYGLAVIRKKSDSSKWMDTNNSTEDFLSDAEASMLKAPTAIDSIARNSSKETKIYRLDGVRVNDTNTPGIYIINGRKVMK